ncbi:hypothetical protein DFJ58DRAFT_784745 [Suillus subalutaceus]|uniref:uncharacterized protein n=1 Tax=Suillus subalutaceus TaxID=48586 RepID=UPI001B872FEF|nr:uncharacterized protein DFJ58DRAFT_784745 [Suillus subalutaceus]KAG1856363.1 hypothetical protein DFJ58DRAFT_784745 [Suillus subalutaceus]
MCFLIYFVVLGLGCVEHARGLCRCLRPVSQIVSEANPGELLCYRIEITRKCCDSSRQNVLRSFFGRIFLCDLYILIFTLATGPFIISSSETTSRNGKTRTVARLCNSTVGV